MQNDIILTFFIFFHANAYSMTLLSDFLKLKRRQLGFTQEDLAEKAGVALTVVRKIEQGKENLNLAKVNQILQLFGHEVGPINSKDAAGNSVKSL